MSTGNISYVPHFQRYSSSTDDDTVVQQLGDAEDINKPNKKTSDDNAGGCVVRCTDDGKAVYNDAQHQLVFDNEAGTIMCFDRESMGDESLEMNFVIKDGYVTFHNPDPNAADPYLTYKIPDEGMELQLSGGTTLYLEKNEDGSLDAHITNMTGPKADPKVDPTSGFLANFDNIGGPNHDKFVTGVNCNGATTGGNSFDAQWDRTHARPNNNHSDKNGDVKHVVVASMKSTGTWSGHDRRLNRDQDNDPSSPPGGFSCVSAHTKDVKGTKQDKYVWHDFTDADNFDKKSLVTTPDDVRALMEQGDSGAQAFDNAHDDNPTVASIYGQATVADDNADTSGDSGTDGADLSEDASGGHSVGASRSSGASVSLAELLSSSSLFGDREEERRRANAGN